MSMTIRDLWPADALASDVLSPVAILRIQAARLGERTKGLLEAEVTTTSDGAQVSHEFRLIAPALNRYCYDLFSISHRQQLVYPATIESEAFDEPAIAHSQDEFISDIRTILSSSTTRAVIHSLIARSNDDSPPKDVSPPPTRNLQRLTVKTYLLELP